MVGKRRRAKTTRPLIRDERLKLNPQEDKLRLCRDCEHWTTIINEYDLSPSISTQGYRHSAKRELFANARWGCPFCFWIHSILRNIWSVTSGGHLRMSPIDSWKSTPGSGLPNRIVAMVSRSSDDTKFPNVYFRVSRRPKIFKTASSLEEFLKVSRTRALDMASPQAMQRARKSLEICKNTHKKCARNNASLLPTRVLDVGASNTSIKLYITKPGEVGEYIALSYCWGGPQQYMTTTNTISEFCKEISLVNLPLTLRDAVEVTRQLNFQYLWIDALCILQNCAVDKTKEIHNMGNIYKNATLTIAAASALKADEGILWKVPSSRAFQWPLKLSTEEYVCAQVSLLGFDFRDSPPPYKKYPLALEGPEAEKEPLDKRGWALQESVLSSRLLTYGMKEMAWQCRTKKIMKTPNGAKSIKTLPLGVFNNFTERNTNTDFQKNRVSTWHSIVEDYTARELGLPSDRGPAVSGIASELAIYWKDDYLAGLWRTTLIDNLAWYSKDNLPRFLEQNLIKNGHFPVLDGPSWSWVAHSTKVSFLRVTSHTLEVLDCTVQLRDQDFPFANVTSGCLIVKSKFCSVDADFCNCRFLFDDGKRHLTPSDFDEDNVLELLLLGFTDGRGVGMMIQKVSTTPTKYTRRGLWQSLETEFENNLLWQERSFQKFTIV